jgi:hypothetical protein
MSDFGRITDSLRQAYTLKNWLKSKPTSDCQDFSRGDDFFLALLLKTEKVFNIVIRDEKAENTKTINNINNHVIRRTEKTK